MQVLFDHQIFSLQRYGGISRYFAMLAAGIQTVPANSSQIATLCSANEYLQRKRLVLNNALGNDLFAQNPKGCYIWNRRFSRWYVQLGRFDVFHPTYYDPYFIRYCKKPCVVTVHDMVHELYPHYFADAAEMIERKKKVLHAADALIAVSEHTWQSIVQVYPELADKITVVHHGYRFSTDIAPAIRLPERYILFVGERWHYKNFTRFITAIAPLLKDYQLHLICAGGGAFSAAEMKLLQSHYIAAQCLQMNVTDTTLKQLYSRAELFVFPSLMEGFGLPLLEAFAGGCPVVCSRTAALPEVAGEAAIYFDPENTNSMQQVISQVLHDTYLQLELKKKGTARLQFFTFENSVQSTLQVYQSLL